MPSIMRRINVIARCAAQYKSDKTEGEIAGAHHAFFYCITKNEGMSQDEISHYLCLNKSTVARALSILEESGFVRRESDAKDKRILRVYSTEKMREAVPRVREIAKEWNEMIAMDISEEEMKIFDSVISRMEQRAKAITFGRGER